MIATNNIYLGDCFELLPEIEDKSVDLVVSDCPYEFSNGNWLTSRKTGKKSILNGSCLDTDGDVYDSMSAFGEEDINRLLDMLVPKMRIPNMYFFCSEEQVPYYGMYARRKGLHFQLLVWEKPLSIINRNRFSQHTEYIVRIYDFGTGLNPVQFNDYYSKVLRDAPIHGKSKYHPTQKPTSIMRKFIMLSSNEGDVVLDPFMGSGSTIVSAIECGRRYIGIEKNEKYYKIAESRMKAEKSQMKFEFEYED